MPTLYKMRAPTGEVADVPQEQVDLFRRNGAVLLGPATMAPVASHGGPQPPMSATINPSLPQPILRERPPGPSPIAPPQLAPMAPAVSHDSRPYAQQLWERANTPIVTLPRVEEDSMSDVGRDLSQHPGMASSLAALRSLGQRGVNATADVAESQLTPIGITTAGLGLGGRAAGQAGYLGISRLARGAEAALSVPYVAEGVHNVVSADSPGQALGGVVQAGMGALGVGQALNTHGFTPVRYGKDAIFNREVAANSAGESLTQQAPEQFLQRRSGDRVYYGLNPRTDGGPGHDMTSLMNNQPGYTGAIKEAFPDAERRGAMTGDAWAVKSKKFPDGMLPTLYKRQGWREVKREAYDVAKYGEPSEALKASWKSQGWKEGDPIPDVAYLSREPGGPARSGDTSPARPSATDNPGGPAPPTGAGAVSSPPQPSIDYDEFEKRFHEEMGTTPKRQSSGLGSTAVSLGAPIAARMIPDDPNSEWDDRARMALNVAGLGGAFAMASRTFPPEMKAKLDAEKARFISAAKAKYIKAGGDPEEFKLKDAKLQTNLKNFIRKATGSAREADRTINAYETIPLPVDPKTGIDFDIRKPLEHVLEHDEPGTATTTTDTTARGVKFSEFTQKRMDAAYDAGVERAKTEGWGDPRYLYHLTNGDPKAAVRLARLFGSFSPGQKTGPNSIQAVEAFIRSAMGENHEQILGKRVPDPADPGEFIRVGGSMSYKHVRPGTVEDNLIRAVNDGRIFQEKVEALSAAEVGIQNKIPIDMWLLRALGAESDTTPGTKWYRLISEAVTKEAAKRGETPFGYMAKTWMGMQDIAGANTPSFQAALSKARLEEPIVNRSMQERFVKNPENYTRALRDKEHTEVGEVFPIANNPQMSYEAFLPELHQGFEAGTGYDYLGKKTIVKNPDPVTLASMRLESQAKQMADEMEGQKRTTRGPGKFMLLPDGTTKWYPHPGFVEKSGRERSYKTPKGAVTIKKYEPKNAPEKKDK